MSVLDLGDAPHVVAAPHAAADDGMREDHAAQAPQQPLAAELAFYESYAWCLNPHLTVGQAIDRLRHEIDRLTVVPHGWQTDEVVTNVYLLSCGLLNCVDEYLRGPGLRLPWRLAAMRVGRGARWAAENVPGNLRPRPSARVRRWREQWLAGLDDFLSLMVAGQTAHPAAFAPAGGRLAALLRAPLPSGLRAARVGVPSPFRRLDLTHHDVLALGRCFVRRFPDRAQPILLVGLRTSGSYFAPLLRAFLKTEGFGMVALLTMVAGKGPGRWERRELARYAEQGYTAVIVDDPPHTGGTIFTALDIARRAGFGRDRLKALIPAHPARQDWYKPLPDDVVVSLAPSHWHKRALLDPQMVQTRLLEYFRAQNFARARVVASRRADEMNAALQGDSSDARGARLKRIFEVHLETPQGHSEIRYVLAKSVGWGWLGYHAFLAGHRLSGFVPPILGQRDGILYMEWIPQLAPDTGDQLRRDQWIDTAASYVAARARRLSLDAGSAAGVDLQRQDAGVRLLAQALGRAYGAFPTDILMRPRLERLLRRQPCPVPTLIDGNMQRADWVVGPHGLLKTDYEHHGMGKEELNVVDPAYDLADTILNLNLSPEEEARLLARYVAESGDAGVTQRLFRNKLLAGLWAMKQARDHLFGKQQVAAKQQAFHLRFMSAWHFLTVEAARQCGGYGEPPAAPGWRSPLVALDIDGVIDSRLFGFPCTTAAGIEALALLRAHGFSVAVDTARSVAEVKAYCAAYGLAGGVAEHGSYLWDAVSGRGRALIGTEAARQLDELRKTLRRIPGVFLDDRHQYSVRAFTYRDEPRGLFSMLVSALRGSAVGDGALAPLPALVINHVMADLGLDRLCFHHTTIDTTIVAKEADKGSGLTALRDWVLPNAETIAVGDQEPDLAMFRVATRSFAPANIGCARQAQILGCRIARHADQRGLLEIARALAHPDGARCQHCAEGNTPAARAPDLFMDVLRAADRSRIANLFGTVLDRSRFRIFTRRRN
jgi:hydroxymethylpyrimidine pyrophosphatase-like HAD family hydrolase